MASDVMKANPPSFPLESGVAIAWRAECYRTRATARMFNVPVFLFANTQAAIKWAKPLAYAACVWKTVRLLFKTRPRTVICHNLPVFLPLVCQVYSSFSGARLVLDFHSGALTHPLWRRFTPYYRHLARRAPFTLCHNRVDAETITTWGARVALVLSLPHEEFPGVSYHPSTERPLFFFVCSFTPDEPVDIMLNAMSLCPECDFIISGNYSKSKLKPDAIPAHVRLSGYLEYSRYLAVMAKATAVITLSDQPHIFQNAIDEAITIGVPVVTNRSPTVIEVLGDAGVFSELDPKSLASAVREAVSRHQQLVEAASHAKYKCWKQVADEMKRVLAEDMEGEG